ncbi:MAG: hypothetical protein IJZ34_04440 [Lachnospiraceae bacterium]|nr:hypothetical protein [Lachnospiraceae bacterium]
MDKLDLILEKLGTFENSFTTLKDDVSSLKDDVTTLKDDVTTLKDDVTTLKDNTATLNNKVTDLQLTLENETNRNIRTIAEGHLDLSRKLDDALKVENEKEMLIIRVNILENDVCKIKTKLEIA